MGTSTRRVHYRHVRRVEPCTEVGPRVGAGEGRKAVVGVLGPHQRPARFLAARSIQRALQAFWMQGWTRLHTLF